MWWVFFVALQLTIAYRGFRQAKSEGTWSWSEFIFALAFAALEFCILWLPMRYIDLHSRWFAPGVTAAALLAVGNFIWFISICRHWRMPDGRTSLQIWHDLRSGKADKTT